MMADHPAETVDMSIVGIDAVTYGVEDLDQARRFFRDWGLVEMRTDTDGTTFETLIGVEVCVRPSTCGLLPPPFERGSTLREVIWGVESRSDLERLVEKLARGWPVTWGPDGVARCVDPNGLTIGFRVSQRRRTGIKATLMNAPGDAARVDQAAPVYERATPIWVGHVVVFASDLTATEAFYCDRLGFVPSDRYPGLGVFLRCRPVSGHHNLFLLARPGRSGLNHVAFTVRDIHEVFGGGLAMSRKGWETDIGPGRHPISGAYFWYFKNPCGGAVEYYADEDYLTERWQPRNFERTLENYTEWAVMGGIDGKTRRQKA